MLRTMLTQFDKVAGEVGLDQAQATAGVDPYSALIVASLVEKEAKVDEDRAKIARVIYNRLASGTPLGVDASLCYLKDEKPCVLHQSDLDSSSPYNTRKVVGLPPTPISNVTPRLARRRAAPGRRRLDLLRARPRPPRGPAPLHLERLGVRRREGSVASPPAWAATDVVLSGRTQVAAVIGDPVEHSLSPAILNAAFAAIGLDWAYVAFEVGAGDVARGARRRAQPRHRAGCR